MTETTIADRLRRKDADAVRQVSTSVLLVRGDNLIPRPWGGRRLFGWKGLEEPQDGRRYGEVFEVSGDRRDEESAAYPSVVKLADGSVILLPELLDVAGPEVLGCAVFEAHGPNLPLLPKTLDVKDLLSLQAHPAGNPEAYLILEADAGATLRLGFVRDLQEEALRSNFTAGREAQESLLADLQEDADLEALQHELSHAFTQGVEPDDLLDRIEPFLREDASRAEVRTLLACLKGAWRQTLGLLTEVPAVPGSMIFNATLAGSDTRRSAEVHALGNPERREVVLLEIRCPAPTLRAWDHVRFPLRDIDVEKALGAMSLGAREADSFVVSRAPIAGRPGAFRTAACEAFVVEHLCPSEALLVDVPADPAARTLHMIRGEVRLEDAEGRELATLVRGRSAIAPAALKGFRVRALSADAELVCVRIPAEGEG